MKDGFAEDFTLSALRKKITNKYPLGTSNTQKYNVYFKRYAQTCVKETVRLYTSIKEFRLVKGV
jgi:hypothetical protein